MYDDSHTHHISGELIEADMSRRMTHMETNPEGSVSIGLPADRNCFIFTSGRVNSVALILIFHAAFEMSEF